MLDHSSLINTAQTGIFYLCCHGNKRRNELYVYISRVFFANYHYIVYVAYSQLHLLKEVCLRGLLLSSAGPPRQVAETTPSELFNHCSLASDSLSLPHF